MLLFNYDSAYMMTFDLFLFEAPHLVKHVKVIFGCHTTDSDWSQQSLSCDVAVLAGEEAGLLT